MAVSSEFMSKESSHAKDRQRSQHKPAVSQMPCFGGLLDLNLGGNKGRLSAHSVLIVFGYNLYVCQGVHAPVHLSACTIGVCQTMSMSMHVIGVCSLCVFVGEHNQHTRLSACASVPSL